MRASRAVLVTGGCAVILGTGWVVAPKEVPTLDLATPVDTGTPTAAATPGASPSASPSETAGDTAEPEATSGTFDGPAVTNARGDYQARITVMDGTVTDVQAVVAGTQDPQSVQINATAIPELREKVLEAQSWEVEAVSGASFTSPAMIESLEGAFEAAGL